MNIKSSLAKRIPIPILNNFLLFFPFLYKTRFLNYESYVDKISINELTQGIENVKNLSGDVIECGSARCGTTCILANYLKNNNIKKKIYALDSFEGFDEIELKKENELGFTHATKKDFSYSSIDYVTKKIKNLQLSEYVTPIKGYFEDSLPKINSDFCFGFIDCDLQKSMEFSAETIWKKLTPGGILFFDDYTSNAFKGAKIAIDNFVNSHNEEIFEHGINHRLYQITKTS